MKLEPTNEQLRAISVAIYGNEEMKNSEGWRMGALAAWNAVVPMVLAAAVKECEEEKERAMESAQDEVDDIGSEMEANTANGAALCADRILALMGSR